MRIPTVLDELVLEFLHPDETNQALHVLSIRDPSLQTWDDWKWNPKRLVVGTTIFKSKVTTIDGIVHSINDTPAIVEEDGQKVWYKKGKTHRDNDQPALIESDGSQWWYIDGEVHRENDKPALVAVDGTRAWYYKGVRHRDNRKPALVSGSHEHFFDHGTYVGCWIHSPHRHT